MPCHASQKAHLIMAAVRQHGLGHTPLLCLHAPFLSVKEALYHFFSFSAFHFFSLSFFQLFTFSAFHFFSLFLFSFQPFTESPLITIFSAFQLFIFSAYHFFSFSAFHFFSLFLFSFQPFTESHAREYKKGKLDRIIL